MIDHCVASPYVVEGNAVLGTIVPKSSIKDQFVPKKHQSTVRFHQKERKEEEQSVLAFQEGTVPKSERERLRKTTCAQTSLVKRKKAKEWLNDHFEENNQMPKVHWTK